MQVYMLNWRLVIIKSELPSNAKFIALYLSTWMNEWGDNCYPSIARISHETGLSKPTVIKYIQVLRDQGWLESRKKGFDGQAWAHNQYYPNVPEKEVKEFNHLSEGGKTESKRRLNSQQKAVKEVNTRTTDNSTDNSTEVKAVVSRCYPPELNQDAWTEYIEYRKDSKMRKLLIKSEDKLIEKLIKLSKQDQSACVSKTIECGWTGLFPEKMNGKSNKQPNTSEQFMENLRDIGGY